MARKKILLVDDSKTVLMMEKMLIGSRDYDITTASDGAEAVAKASRDKPDLILMDIVMPVMNGLDAVKTLRGIDATKWVPIIMVTTRSEIEAIEKSYVNGCTDYVTKPIDGAELMAKIHNFLGE